MIDAVERLPFTMGCCSAGGTDRAVLVSILFEAGKVTLDRRMPALAAQLLGMIAGGGHERPETSPDRADAMVWEVTEVTRKARDTLRNRVSREGAY